MESMVPKDNIYFQLKSSLKDHYPLSFLYLFVLSPHFWFSLKKRNQLIRNLCQKQGQPIPVFIIISFLLFPPHCLAFFFFGGKKGPSPGPLFGIFFFTKNERRDTCSLPSVLVVMAWEMDGRLDERFRTKDATRWRGGQGDRGTRGAPVLSNWFEWLDI